MIKNRFKVITNAYFFNVCRHVNSQCERMSHFRITDNVAEKNVFKALRTWNFIGLINPHDT